MRSSKSRAWYSVQGFYSGPMMKPPRKERSTKSTDFTASDIWASHDSLEFKV